MSLTPEEPSLPPPDPSNLQTSSSSFADNPKVQSDPMAGLAARVQEGDNTAWEPLVKGLSPYVWRVVCVQMQALPREEQLAAYKDVWAEIYLAIRERFQFRSMVSTYAWMTAYYFCLKRFSGRGTPGKEIAFDPQAYDNAEANGRTGMSALVEKEQSRRLLDCISRLTEIDQRLLRMKYFETDEHGNQFELTQIAKSLGFNNANSAGQALHRARRRLKDMMGDLQ